MHWETPEITDLGSIADHTFLNPGGDEKGTEGLDPFGEISDHGS